MRKNCEFLFAAGLCLFFAAACADKEHVYDKNKGLMSQDTAIRTALNWMELQYPTYPKFEVKDVKTIVSNGRITSYQIEFVGGGFVITSANYDTKPIMAYSARSVLRDADPVANEIVSEFSQSIGGRKQSQETIDSNRFFWDKIQNPTDDARRALSSDSKVEPLITTTWGQSGGYEPNFTYNAATPYVTDGNKKERAPVGCAAVAFGQVLKYYNYPKKGVGYNSYCNGDSVPCPDDEKVEAAFFETKYNWAAMTNSLHYRYSPTPENIEAISTLLYHIGASINVKYGYHGSGAKISNASVFSEFKKHFQMSGIETVKKSDYSDEEWYELIAGEIKAGRPVILSGTDSDLDAGHAYILDGIHENNGYVHVNWGWSGGANGYFDLSTLVIDGKYSFTEDLVAYINLTPDVEDVGSSCNGPTGKRCRDGLVCALNDDINQVVDELTSDEYGKCLSLNPVDEVPGDVDAGSDEDTDTEGVPEEDGGSSDPTEPEDEPHEPITLNGTVAKGEWVEFGPFEMANGILVEMKGTGAEGDNGDADLYVRRDRAPNQYTFHCRPGNWGSDETCELAGPGRYFVSVYGYADLSAFTLVISEPAN